MVLKIYGTEKIIIFVNANTILYKLTKVLFSILK